VPRQISFALADVFRQEAVASVARCRVCACGARARVSRQPHAPRQPRPRRPRAAPPPPANNSDVPSMSLEQQRCSIDAVCGRARAGRGRGRARVRGWGRGRGERGVRDMRCGTAGGANPACRSTSCPAVRAPATELPPTRHPEQNSPVAHKALHFDLVMESTAICEFRRLGRTNLEPGNLTYLAKLTAEFTAGRPYGELGASGLHEIPVCAPKW
jgi:hypothetical protein